MNVAAPGSRLDPRNAVRDIFLAGVDAARPAEAVRAAIRSGPQGAVVIAGRAAALPGTLRVIGIGKASVPMARAALDVIPADLLAAPPLAVVHDEGASQPPGVLVLEAGHPVPDERGAAAAGEVERLLAGTEPGDGLLVLLSGGASALLPAPVRGISLEDKVATTRLLLACGADIGEVNTVRKHLSRLKGGRLASLAAPAAVESLIVSDVVGDDLATIASGPTAPDPTTYADALEVLRRRGLLPRVPGAVRRLLDRGARGVLPETPKPGDPALGHVENRIVASGRTSLDASLRTAGDLGLEAEVASAELRGEAREAGAGLARRAAERLGSGAGSGAAFALLAAGETTVTVRGRGLGGRNQELALAFALEAERLRLPGSWAFLSGGTDGRDGPTDAAGAVVDPGTLDRGRRAGRSPEADLAANDAYRFLDAAGDLLRMGATGTNVADLQVLVVAGLAKPASPAR